MPVHTPAFIPSDELVRLCLKILPQDESTKDLLKRYRKAYKYIFPTNAFRSQGIEMNLWFDLCNVFTLLAANSLLDENETLIIFSENGNYREEVAGLIVKELYLDEKKDLRPFLEKLHLEIRAHLLTKEWEGEIGKAFVVGSSVVIRPTSVPYFIPSRSLTDLFGRVYEKCVNSIDESREIITMLQEMEMRFFSPERMIERARDGWQVSVWEELKSHFITLAKRQQKETGGYRTFLSTEGKGFEKKIGEEILWRFGLLDDSASVTEKHKEFLLAFHLELVSHLSRHPHHAHAVKVHIQNNCIVIDRLVNLRKLPDFPRMENGEWEIS